MVLLQGEPVVATDEASLMVVEQRRQMVRQDGETLVRHTGRQEVADVRCERELELGVLGKQGLPVMEVLARPEELAEPPSAVSHQQPTVIDVERDDLGDAAGRDPLEDG
jgi:hypothetical protein